MHDYWGLNQQVTNRAFNARVSNLSKQLKNASDKSLELSKNRSPLLRSTASWQQYLDDTSHFRLNDNQHRNTRIKRKSDGFRNNVDTDRAIHQMFLQNGR